MTNIEHAMRWAKIADRLYEIETTTTSFRKEWLVRHYRWFVAEMCTMYFKKGVYGKD